MAYGVLRICVCLAVFCYTETRTSSKIPNHLIQCYNTENIRKDNPPLTTRTLVELLLKLEQNRTEPNLRQFSNFLLHKIKFDGVEHSPIHELNTTGNLNVLPYRATGQQFHKYQLLVDHLTSDTSTSWQFPAELDPRVLCLLHLMLSNTIDSRGVCCSLKGVMQTAWGTVAPGYLIAGIASALQRDRAPLMQVQRDLHLKSGEWSDGNRMVSNVWMATVGGLLAQVVISQASENPRIASPGAWNDSLLPRMFYLKAHHWDINTAEMLGALDGLILAEKVHDWLEANPAMRLSQLLDMYYSCRGVAYDRSTRAAERQRHFVELLHRNDFVEQTITAVQLLNAFGTFDKTIRAEMIAPLARAAVRELEAVVDESTFVANCVENEQLQGRWEIILIADQTYSPYAIQQLLSALIDAVDVSPYSSNLALLNGHRGEWLLHPTHDILTIFDNLTNIPDVDWPKGLSLTASLEAIIAHHATRGSVCRVGTPKGSQIVVLGQTSTPTSDDFASASLRIASLKHIAPQTRIAYVTRSEADTFKQLQDQWPSNSVTLHADGVAGTVAIIRESVRHLPASLGNNNCKDTQINFEDYLTPDAPTTYEMSVTAGEASVQFRTLQRANVSICLRNETCKQLTVNDEVTFRVQAATLFFDVVAAKSSVAQCAAFACRYPDQVLVEMQTTWRSRAPTHNAPSSPSWRCVIAILSVSTFFRFNS